MRFKSNSTIARFGLSLLSLLLTLAGLELVFRLAGIRAQYHRPRVLEWLPPPDGSSTPAPCGFIPFAAARFTYDSDPRGYFEPGNVIEVHHNSVGWRDIEHTLAKPAGSYRIVGLGDSYLWGEGVKRENICLTKLPPLLADAADGWTIETINTGFSSLSTVDEYDRLVRCGLKYDPDLVIVHFVLNDVVVNWHEGPKIEFHQEYTSIYQSPDALSHVSYLWGWGRQRFLRYVRAQAYVRECLDSFRADSSDWQQCRQALDGIRRVCRVNDVALLVVIFPFYHDLDGDYPFQPIHDIVRQECQRRQIPVLDLRDAHRGYSGPELWVHPTDQHPNEIAHEIAARAMARYLKAHPALFSPRAGAEVEPPADQVPRGE